jgi:hypothetical protein
MVAIATNQIIKLVSGQLNRMSISGQNPHLNHVPGFPVIA